MRFRNKISSILNSTHGVHAFLVHVPMLLLPLVFAFDLIGYCIHLPELYETSCYLLVLAIAGAFFSTLFGIVDFLRLSDGTKLFQRSVVHIFLSSVSIMIFLILLLMRSSEHHPQAPVNFWTLILEGITIIILLVGAHFGTLLKKSV